MDIKRNKLVFYIFTAIIFSASNSAAKRAGVITMMKGPVEIFSAPSDSPKASGKQVKFEDSFYTLKKAKIGLKLKFNEVVKTGTTSKVKINFINGDSMMVAPGTAFNLSLLKGKMNKKTKKGQILNLIYGKVRAVISKKGPRNNLRVKTKSAVAGVRGTDFFIGYNPSENATRIDVLRGKVQVKETAAAKPKVVEKGFSLKVQKTKKTGVSELKFRPITKEKLKEIEVETRVVIDKKALKAQSKEVIKQIEELEVKAKKVVLDDIKQDEPKKYKLLMAKSASMTADEINNSVVDELKEKAPTEPEVSKINESDLQKNLQNQSDAYKKYFK